MLSDREIAKKAKLLPISDIAQSLSISSDEIESYGKYKAKIPLSVLNQHSEKPDGKLILVSAINPTPAGEGKTTITIGLGDAIARLGHKTAIALREPSLGPIMGQKGSATGGGLAQIVPRDDINLHFTGDIHAITSAHNLLAALIDNHIQQGNALQIDTRHIIWKRALDVNDRALRQTTIGLGGKLHGTPREDGFIMTVASEIMAVLCLSSSYNDMVQRLSKMIVAYDISGKAVTVGALKAQGAMSVLLRDALKPNLVQTLEHTPCLVHGGPFANIAHGCNSILATKLALKSAEYTITEAGFGADLGAEKFFDIVCPQAGIAPNAVVLVATIRALKYNGGVAKSALEQENIASLKIGSSNLKRHIQNLQCYGAPVIVALNLFASDTSAEQKFLQQYCHELGVQCIPTEVFAKGSIGGQDLAVKLIELTKAKKAAYKPIYNNNLALKEKIETIARRIYGAGKLHYTKSAEQKLKAYTTNGFDKLPVCIAKTQYSFSDDPSLLAAPENFTMHISDVELRAGAGFIVVKMGNIMTMPGLPKKPLAEDMYLDSDGIICGLS